MGVREGIYGGHPTSNTIERDSMMPPNMIPQQKKSTTDKNIIDLKEGSINLGWIANILILGCLPHSKLSQKTGHELLHHTQGVFHESFFRRSAQTSITYSDAVGEYGLPYGSIPRLILIWIITELMQSTNFHKSPEEQNNRRVFLGDSIRHLMREVYMDKNTTTTSRLRHNFWDQLCRLTTCVMSINTTEVNGNIVRHQLMSFFSDTARWGNLEHITRGCYFEVSYEFAKFLLARGVIPLLRKSVLKLRKAPLQIDLYLWLNYRYRSVHKLTSIPWGYLYSQFGSQIGKLSNFKIKIARALEVISVIYPEANYKVTPNSLLLLPSPTHLDIEQKPGEYPDSLVRGVW